MIRTTQSSPATVAFFQKGRDEADAKIASEQIAKAAREEVIAAGAMDNAQFRLEKATEQMKAAEVTYQDAIAKGAWDREELRTAYNNAIAGYREADRIAEAAAEQLSLAKAALEGLRTVAKGRVVDTETTETPAPVRKEDEMNDDAGLDRYDTDDPSVILIACPECGGLDPECDACDGDGLMEPDEMLEKSVDSGFGTASLLTRNFEKSVAYQSYIEFSKGGPGSGRRKGDGRGHLGNQHSGATRFHPNLLNPKTGEKGLYRGWKTTIKVYTQSAKEAKQLAELHTNAAVRHEQAGRFAKAAEEHLLAAASHMVAAGNHEGIASTYKREIEKFGNGDHPDIPADGGKSERGEAAKERVYAERSKQEAARLQAMAA